MRRASAVDSASLSACDLIDLVRYPLDDLDSDAGYALVQAARVDLEMRQAFILPAFLRPDAVRRLAAEADLLAPVVFRKQRDYYSYSEEPDPALPADHPRLHRMVESMGFLGYDKIPVDTGLRNVYEWDPLTEFVRRVLGLDHLYRYGDPIAALTLSVFKTGNEVGWHYDMNDFVVSLLLQEPETGGVFEYVPLIRSKSNENYAAVARIFAGRCDDVVSLDMAPGSLVLFQGRNSLHRVTPVRGTRRRLILLLAYDALSGGREGAYSLREAYGRARTDD